MITMVTHKVKRSHWRTTKFVHNQADLNDFTEEVLDGLRLKGTFLTGSETEAQKAEILVSE